MLMLMLAALPALMAQEPPNVQMPELDAQAFRPSIDSQATLWTDDASVAPGGTASLRLAGNWAHAPLVIRWGEGETLDLVRDSVNLDLLAGVTLWRLRLGADLPLYLLSTSDIDGGGGGLGDIGIDVRGSILDERSHGFGLAMSGRLDLPTSTVDAALGSPGLGGELGLVGSKHFGDLLVAANLGTRFAPETQLVNVVVDDQFFYRLGGGYALNDAAGLSLDVAGHVNYNEPFGNHAANPIEGLLGGWYRLRERLVLRGGVGHGFTKGIASPDLRLVAMVSWEPPRESESIVDTPVEVQEAVAPPENPAPVIAQAPPPAPGLVQVRVTGPDGAPVVASFTVGDSMPVTASGGQGELEVAPGALGITVRAEGFAVANRKVVVEPGETEVVEVQLRPTQVALTVEKIEIEGEVFFDTAKASIKPESFTLLDEVAQVMIDHPELLRLRVEGHTDSRGDNASNLVLSKDRAAAVLAYLIDKGVAPERLVSQGFGETKPLDKHENATAWKKNRRVDFFVTQRDETVRGQELEE